LNLNPNKVLTEIEADNLLRYLDTRREHAAEAETGSALLDELIVMALLLSGLRNSEFCGLAVGDTVLGSGRSTIQVREPSTRPRVVHVPNRVSELVRDYAEQVRPGWLPANVDPNDRGQPLVFGENGRPFDRTSLYRRVVKVLTNAGFGDRASVQLLRHTYGYLAYLRTGGNLLFVQRQLGHSHPRVTAAYAKLVKESYAELAERVAPQAWRTPEHAARSHDEFRAEFDCGLD